MGFFDIFKPRSEDQAIAKSKLHELNSRLMESFSAIKQDISQQAEWIDYLHKNTQNIHKKHDSHKSEVTVNLNKLNKWVKHLHSSSKSQTENIEALETAMLRAFELYNKHILDLHKKVEMVQPQEVDTDNLKREVVAHIKPLMEAHQNDTKHILRNHLERHTESLITSKIKDFKPKEVIREKPVITPSEPKIVHHYSNAPLSNPEKKLLTMLFNSSDPLSYQQVSDQTGHSVNTVRVNMNLLKKKNLVEENTLPSGVKLFNISNKEKIKKMYNLQMI